MIESLCRGIIVSLAFIGFVSVVYSLLIHIHSVNDGFVCISYLDENFTINDFRNLIYRTGFLNMILNNCFDEIILVYDGNLTSDISERIDNFADEAENVVLLESSQLVDYFKRKGMHGTGIY